MQIPSWPLQLLRSGGISILKDGKEIFQLKIEERVIAVNLEEIGLVGDLLKIGAKPEERSILKMLKEQKSFAERLKKDGLTITVSHKGKVALKLGAGANPSLTRLLTFSKAIEIKSMGKLIQIAKELR